MKRKLPLAALLCVVSACSRAAIPPAVTSPSSGVKFEIESVPPNTPESAGVFLAGSFNGWRPGSPAYRLHNDGGGRYSLTVPDTLSGTIEFKFTRGSWEYVELDSAGNGVPNRIFVIPATGRALIKARIARWQDPSKIPARKSTARPGVSMIAKDFAIPQLGRSRRILIYLPPDYAASTKRYPVLYMHDGQNVFDAATSYAGEWGVDETLDSLSALGAPEAIVVAVDNSDHRLDEYSPWPNEKYGGGEGEKYVDFLIQTLKPYIDSHYRTLSDRSNTAIAGSSMGGLISLYAALKHPEVFSRAGVFSPAIWFSPMVWPFVHETASSANGVRLYIVSGGLEAATGEPAGIYVKDQARLVDSLVAAGKKPMVDFVSLVPPDGVHSEWFWRREFPKAFLWLFRER